MPVETSVSPGPRNRWTCVLMAALSGYPGGGESSASGHKRLNSAPKRCKAGHLGAAHRAAPSPEWAPRPTRAPGPDTAADGSEARTSRSEHGAGCALRRAYSARLARAWACVWRVYCLRRLMVELGGQAVRPHILSPCVPSEQLEFSAGCAGRRPHAANLQGE